MDFNLINKIKEDLFKPATKQDATSRQEQLEKEEEAQRQAEAKRREEIERVQREYYRLNQEKAIRVMRALGFTPEDTDGSSWGVNVSGKKTNGENIWISESSYNGKGRFAIRVGYDKGDYKLQGSDERIPGITVSAAREDIAIINDIKRRLLPLLPPAIAKCRARVDGTKEVERKHRSTMELASAAVGLPLENTHSGEVISYYEYNSPVREVKVSSHYEGTRIEIELDMETSLALQVLQAVKQVLGKNKK